MTQTRSGALKAQATIVKRYGVTEDGRSKLHVESGRKGGAKSRGGGFTSKTAGKWGAIGGRASRRTKTNEPS